MAAIALWAKTIVFLDNSISQHIYKSKNAQFRSYFFFYFG